MSDTVEFIKEEILELRAKGWSDSKIRSYLVSWWPPKDADPAHPCLTIPGGCYAEDVDRAFEELGGRRQLMTDNTKKVLIVGGLFATAVLLARSKPARRPFGYGPSTEDRLRRSRRRILGGLGYPEESHRERAYSLRYQVKDTIDRLKASKTCFDKALKFHDLYYYLGQKNEHERAAGMRSQLPVNDQIQRLARQFERECVRTAAEEI